MMRVARTGAALGIALFVGAWGLPAIAAAPEPVPADAPVVVAATPSITVTPSTDLVSGDSVAVHGTGFPPGEVGVAQCRAGLTNFNECYLNEVQFVDAAADGTFDVEFMVRRSIRLGSGIVRCADAPDTCVVAAGNIADQTQGASQPISFDPTVPGAAPSVSLNPDVDLVDGQSVVANGAGFRPNSVLLIAQCVTDTPYCSFFSGPISVFSGGTFAFNYEVHNRLSSPTGTVSCLVTVCELQVFDFDDPDYDASVLLAFDPDGPQPTIPAITVTPDTQLTDRQTVVIEGTGFDPNGFLFVQQCPTLTDQCSPADLGFIQADAAGTFSENAVVRRRVGRYAPAGVESVDCAVDACEVIASQGGSFTLTASTPIAFDPSVPLPPLPTVTAAPTTDLPYRQTVTIQGSGFTPGSFVGISRCGSSDEGGFCSTGASAVTDEAGNLNATVVVRRFFANAPFGTLLDCAGPATCELQVAGNDLLDSVTFPLTFDPNAPAPPPPTLTVDPATGLGYRQRVAVHATGFAPNDQVSLLQCPPETSQFVGPCSGFQAATADASGTVDTSFTVRRTLSNGFEEPTDCATAPGTCVLRIDSQDGGEHTEAPLAFDPNAPIPPPPTLTATPATNLVDGQVVTLEGTGYSPNASMGFTLCAAGTLSLNRCNIQAAGFGTADADGNFTGQLAVVSTIPTPNGPIDCAAAPGTCEFAAANTGDYIENGRTPASFGPEVGIESVAVSARVSSARLGVVKVALSGPSAREVRVHYATADGSATAPSDYLAASGDLVFAPGQTSKLIWVGIVADGTRDRNEELFVDLSGPQGGSLGGSARATVEVARDRTKHDGHHHHHHHDGHHRHHHHGHHHRHQRTR